MVELFDAHAHLQDERIREHVDEILRTSRVEGVTHWACNGTCEADWPEVQALATEYPAILPQFGHHPYCLDQLKDGWQERLHQQLLQHPEAGLGECGLDRGKRGSHTPIEEQEGIFEQQVQMAQELNRPVSVHCVQHFGKLQQLLQKLGPFPAGLVLHSWAGSANMTQMLAKIEGVHFSISGHLTALKQVKAEAMLQQVPLDRLLLETDAPDGLPQGDVFRGRLHPLQAGGQAKKAHQLNHPANIRTVLGMVAGMRPEGAEEIAQAATANANHVFRPGKHST